MYNEQVIKVNKNTCAKDQTHEYMKHHFRYSPDRKYYDAFDGANWYASISCIAGKGEPGTIIYTPG